ARIQKTVCLENKVFVILIPRSVVSIGIEDQLGMWHVLNQIKRIHCIHNEIVVSARDERRVLDVLQICEAFSRLRSPLADGGNLCCCDLVADWGIAVLSAREIALQEGSASSLTLLRISEEDFEPQVLG